MDRRTPAAACLAALITVGAALPLLGLAPRTAAASCSGWSSEAEPPSTIRVFRHVSGEVDMVDFRAYTKNVLSREWIASWTTESLRSGALAVKHYAWYQVLHWRGGVNSAGECFDLRDDTYDQVYDPSKPTWSTAAAAVDVMWGTRVLKNGAIFPTYYNAGAMNEPCGANANGWKAYQWGTQACGLAASRAAEIILVYYYPGVTVTDAPAPTGTPTPTASPTPVATASPTPAATPTPTPGSSATPTPAASAIATPTATPTPAASATPVPSPLSTPLPTPPPVQELPGGGQSSVADAAAPPPPPPPSPKPVVAAPESSTAAAPVVGRSGATIPRMLEWSDPANVASVQVTRWLGGMLRANGHSRPADALRPDDRPRFDLRLALFDSMWEAALRQLVDALTRDLGTERALALGSLLGRPVPASILTLGEVQQAEGWIVDPRRHASYLVLP